MRHAKLVWLLTLALCQGVMACQLPALWRCEDQSVCATCQGFAAEDACEPEPSDCRDCCTLQSGESVWVTKTADLPIFADSGPAVIQEEVRSLTSIGPATTQTAVPAYRPPQIRWPSRCTYGMRAPPDVVRFSTI
ncbi:MAG TPA: hypothetical protein PLX06_05010 [Fimbriimonadaceae bacterium]|nr:hypothetical protein [Fimbriimonadaceae bacterium]